MGGSLRSVVSAAVLSLTGCSALVDFPLGAEADALTCSDGVDNDGDEASDCADPDCLPFCQETEAELCSNGVDDDSDGVFDARELTCWPFVRIDVDRCSTRRSEPLVVEEANYRRVNGSAGVDLLDGFRFSRAGDDVSFGLAGGDSWRLRLDFGFGDSGAARIELDALDSEIRMEPGPDEFRLFWALAGEQSRLNRSPPVKEGRLELEVESGRLVRVRLSDLDDPGVVLVPEPLLGSTLSSEVGSGVLRVRVFFEDGEPMFLRRLEFAREPFFPCGYDVPQLAEEGVTPLAMAVSPQDVCMLFDAEGLESARTPTSELAGPWPRTRIALPDRMAPTQAALHWTETGYVGAVSGTDDEGRPSIALLEGVDCETWSVRSAPWAMEAIGIFPAVLALEETAEGLRAAVTEDRSRFDVAPLRIFSGATLDRLGFDRLLDFDFREGRPLPRDGLFEGAGVNGLRFVFPIVTTERRFLALESGDTGEPGLELFGPSLLAGTFDEEVVGDPILALAPDATSSGLAEGFLLYGGDEGYGLVRLTAGGARAP